MAHNYNKPGWPFVLLDDNGFMGLYTSTGHLVEGNTRLRITDHCDSVTSYVATGFCNIVKDKEEMLKCIEEWKKS